MAPRLIKGFVTVGGWTMLSRLLGFARDILIARFLGTGVAAEAFFVAFSLPNMFRRFFAEGAFNMAFVPLYAKKLEAEGEDADAFARDAVAGMVMILTLFSVFGHRVHARPGPGHGQRVRRRRAVLVGRHLRAHRISLYPVHIIGGFAFRAF